MIAAVALILAAPAMPVMQRKIERDTGSRIAVPRRARIPEPSGQGEAARARVVMAQFARCAVDLNINRLDAALTKSVDGDFKDSAIMLASDDCLATGQVRFSAKAMRGPVFTEVYRRRAAAEAAGKRWGPVIAKIDLSTASSGNYPPDYRSLMAFGDCVVQADPAGAKAIVLASTTGAAQDAAIVAMAPKLGACLPEGTKFTIGKALLEGVLAEVLYRGVIAPPPVEQAAAK